MRYPTLAAIDSAQELNLGRTLLGDPQMISEAVVFYVKLLANQRRKPQERQQIYLRDFIMVMRQHCPERVISDLSLPTVCDASLRIIIDEPSVDLSSPSKRGAASEAGQRQGGVSGSRSGGGSKEAMEMGGGGRVANDSPLQKEGPFGWVDLEEALLDPRRWRERARQARSSLQNLRGALPDPVPRNGYCECYPLDPHAAAGALHPTPCALQRVPFTLRSTSEIEPRPQPQPLHPTPGSVPRSVCARARDVARGFVVRGS